MEIKSTISLDTHCKNIVKIHRTPLHTASEVCHRRAIQKNSPWQPSCAPAKVSYVAAKRQLKNVGLDTQSCFHSV